MDSRAVSDLRELARTDSDLRARTVELHALDGDVAALRARAEAIDAFFASYPDEEARRQAAVTAAAEELDRRREEASAFERELASARDEETRERIESALRRARDHAAVAEAALERAHTSASELERDAAALPGEVPVLEGRAREVAGRVEHVPPAPTGLRDLVEWASAAHAELFVAVGQVDAQRDRVIREANELATMLLGEATYGSTVAQLAERVLPLPAE